MVSMRRREVISLLGGGVVGWPLVARAQQLGRTRRVSVLMGNAEDDLQTPKYLATLKNALRDLSWVEGRTIQIDYRWAAGDVDRMRTFARELVGLKPDLIVGQTTPVVAALKEATATIPIVFVVVSDPVGSGFVASLPRPGGNITGFINIESSIAGKWLELLKDIAPRVTHAGLMFNPQTAPYIDYYLQPFESAARSQGIEPVDASVHSVEDIDRVIASIGSKPGGVLAVMTDVFTALRPNLIQIISSAARHRVPTIYPYQFMVGAGGLISYGVDNSDLFRRSAEYIDRILKGATPADLPVQLPTKFELAVNLKTAKALGLTVPPSLPARADQVIE